MVSPLAESGLLHLLPQQKYLVCSRHRGRCWGVLARNYKGVSRPEPRSSSQQWPQLRSVYLPLSQTQRTMHAATNKHQLMVSWLLAKIRGRHKLFGWPWAQMKYLIIGGRGALSQKEQPLQSKIRSNCWFLRMYTFCEIANIRKFIS